MFAVRLPRYQVGTGALFLQDGALTSTPNWSRIPIRIASASEADDDELPDDDFFFCGYEPSDPPEASTWSAPPARPVQETIDVEPTSPPARWRCLKCDSTNLTEIGTMQWRCRDSTREEFYKDDQAGHHGRNMDVCAHLGRTP